MRAVSMFAALWLVPPVLADDVHAYGTKARYAWRSVVYYPDLRVVYRGERTAAASSAAAVYRDFDINTDCTAISVTLAPGQTEAEFDAAIGTYVIQVGGAPARDVPLRPDELIVWEKRAYDQAHPARKAVVGGPARP